MMDLNIGTCEQIELLELTETVLWLNSMTSVSDLSSDGVALQAISVILGIDAKTISHGLTHQQLRVGSKVESTRIGSEKVAILRKDALAKAIYNAIFEVDPGLLDTPVTDQR
jgi:myosin heavy subunit